MKAQRAAGKRYEWNVTEPDVHISGDTAWIAYINKGSITDASGTVNQQWLESAILEKQKGFWKILFMHSTRVPTAPPKNDRKWPSGSGERGRNLRSRRAPWVAGNFGAIAREIGAPEAEGFVARIGLELDARVLDIACGTGNVTISLARRGAMVTGLDMTSHLLEDARARATREGLHIRFDEGFAETLPYPDGSFDVVVSMFGIMFSQLPETVASEMARVLRPGGRLALANWTRSGFGGKMSGVVGR
jgi:2-polyprenyl-3-methyl-5-hydroxy-6-metoxy-1,4-benzoquinol methylase